MKKYECNCGHSWLAACTLKVIECQACKNKVKGKFINYPSPKTDLEWWLYLGRTNELIAGAFNPKFDESSFTKCTDWIKLQEKLKINWAVGQAFWHKNLCFINQDANKNEWLMIRGNIPIPVGSVDQQGDY